MRSIILSLILLSSLPSLAGVYGNLNFGDNRATVAKKLKKSKLVDQTMTSTLMGRTGLNGVFKCKAKIAGLTYRLYFNWDDQGSLKEITLRSETVEAEKYSSTIFNAWTEAQVIFTKAYKSPVQQTNFPKQSTLNDGGMLMSHIWHQTPNQSILMGTGQDSEKYFLAIRFINQRIDPVILTKG